MMRHDELVRSSTAPRAARPRRSAFARLTLLSLGGLSLLTACAWDRFDQLRANPPVESLDKQTDRARGFGQAVATTRLGETVMAIVSGGAGSDPASAYTLGSRENPQLDPYDDDHCLPSPAGKICAVIEQPAALAQGRAGGESRDLCFVSGFGKAGQDFGLWTRCIDFFEDVYPVPTDLEDDFVTPLLAGQRLPELRLATDRTDEPVMLAGSGKLRRAWVYAPLLDTPIDVTPNGTAAAGFGHTVAVLRTDTSTLLAVGSSEANSVWLFSFDGTTVEPLGCSSGPDGFGEVLAAGDTNGDGAPDLAVTASDGVHVLDGAALAALAPSAEPACAEGAFAELVRLTCATNDDTPSCGGSNFGHALTVADLDGDGTGEIVVGAPNMTVRDVESAGAALVFDASGKHLDTRIVSDATAGANFGSSLAAASQGEEGANGARDILVVGAPGAQRTNLVYCATVTSTDISVRCE
ncbi:MAG TPA: FG-GAP repeat protein [Polyangiaceae bacterium]|nr:FG-GAP repeat protein [Polyangiaceae bacterium]